MEEERKNYIREKEKLAYINDDQKRKTQDVVVKALEERLDFETVIDLGCGQMEYSFPFKKVVRVDGNEDAKPDYLWDLAEPFGFIGVSPYIKDQLVNVRNGSYIYDLVFSIEVAEHIEPENADGFIENLTRLSNKWIVMTACPPHPGRPKSEYEKVAHLNEQEHSFWIDKIEKRGFNYQQELTEELQDYFKTVPDMMRWFRSDLMVFKKQ